MLGVSYAGNYVGNRIVIAWSEPSDDCAINDALPFLIGAEIVTVLTNDGKEGTQGLGDTPGADIAHHLAGTGAKATVQSAVSRVSRERCSFLA